MRAALVLMGVSMIAGLPVASAAEGTQISLLGVKVTLPLKVPLMPDTDIGAKPLGFDLAAVHLDGGAIADPPIAAGSALSPSSADPGTSADTSVPPAASTAPLGGEDGAGLLGLLLLLALTSLGIVLVAAFASHVRDRRAWRKAQSRYIHQVEAKHRRIVQQRAIHHAVRAAQEGRPVAVAAPRLNAPATQAGARSAALTPPGVERPGAMRATRVTKIAPGSVRSA